MGASIMGKNEYCLNKNTSLKCEKSTRKMKNMIFISYWICDMVYGQFHTAAGMVLKCLSPTLRRHADKKIITKTPPNLFEAFIIRISHVRQLNWYRGLNFDSHNRFCTRDFASWACILDYGGSKKGCLNSCRNKSSNHLPSRGSNLRPLGHGY